MDAYMKQRKDTMDVLRGVVEGTRAVHVWESPHYPGAIMKTVVRWPGVKVDEREHGLPPAFAEEIELTYANTLTKEQAAQKLADMRLAVSSMEDSQIEAL